MAFRAKASNGIWCCFLPALALSAGAITDQNSGSDEFDAVSGVKMITLVLSCFLAASSIFSAYDLLYSEAETSRGLLRHVLDSAIKDTFERASSREARLKKASQVQRKKDAATKKKQKSAVAAKMGIGLAAILLATLWTVGPRPAATLPVIGLACLVLAAYSVLLPKVFSAFPESFTFGEGCLFLQAGVLFAFEASVSLATGADDVSTLEGSFARIAKSGLLSCLLLCCLPFPPCCGIGGWFRTPVGFVCTGFVILFGGTLPYLTYSMKREPITWVLGLIWSSWPRLCFMGIAFALLAASATALLLQRGSKASTAARKYFHLYTVVLYTYGVFADPAFLYLSTFVATATMVLLEGFRYHRIEPFSSLLNSAVATFLDEKDSGALVLTHIYLQAGCSLPLWLSRNLSHVGAPVLLSGVLSIGVGDAAASVVGSRFGRLKFPDSEKSVEGTAASVLAQLSFLFLLDATGLLPGLQWSLALLVPIAVCAVAEALTTQVDNVVLPLMLYALMCLSSLEPVSALNA